MTTSLRSAVAALCLLVIAFGGDAHAQRPSGNSTPDPYLLGELSLCNGSFNCNHGNTDTAGRTLRADQTINTGVRNLVLISAGQSLRAAEAPSAYAPTNAAAVHMLSVYDGGKYAFSDPPLGSSGPNLPSGYGPGSLGGRLADLFINNGRFDQVWIVPIAVGGSSAADWATGALQNRICVALKRIAQKGIVAGANVTIGIEWGQGEQDNALNTGQVAYAASLATILSNAQACGFAGRFFVARETQLNGIQWGPVQAAQVAFPDNVTSFASGDIDSIGNAQRYADQTHLIDTGMASAATLIYNAMHASGAPY